MTFYFWKDKEGKKLTFKEFMQRWKEGIESVDALAQTKMQIWSSIIMVTGIVCGIVVSLFAFKVMWWVFIILVAALGNVAVQLLSLWQKKKLLERFNV